ncbi:hypothetical protein [Nonomuraea salmonea]|uniref:hypothetical protein n=1 Tax=Nonomuraea salmonea TaxID=46181 RepID=UPI0031E88321
MYGSSISGRIWKDSMLEALKGVEPTKFKSVDRSRFGGCTDNCAPKPKKKEEGRRGEPVRHLRPRRRRPLRRPAR